MFSIKGRGLSESNLYASRKRSATVASKRYKRMLSSAERGNGNKIYPEYNIAIIENRSQEIGMAAISSITGKITLL